MIKEGKYTLELFAKKNNLTKASAINKLARLRAKGLVDTTGGGRLKRIYTISNKPRMKTNGFYDLVNKYSPEKLVPKFEHRVIGKYTTEQAIIDGIRIGDHRTLEATKYLFNHIKNWKRLFDLAKKDDLTKEVMRLYKEARKSVKCRRMPRRYEKLSTQKIRKRCSH